MAPCRGYFCRAQPGIAGRLARDAAPLGQNLTAYEMAILDLAAAACPAFDKFFWHFSRPSYALEPGDYAVLPKN